jgi:hypothetical protein
MRKIRATIGATLAIVGAMATSAASASAHDSHTESLTINQDRGTDNSDVYS